MAATSVSENLVPRAEHVEINGRVYTLKKLTLGQLIRLARFSAKLSSDVRERIVERSATETSDVLVIAEEVLAAGLLGELLGIVLGVEDADEHKRLRDIDLESLSELANAITKLNNLDKVFANFKQAGARLPSLKVKETTDGPRSPLPSVS